MNYPLIPLPPASNVGEPVAHYGIRLLTWLMSMDVLTLASMDMEQLELVDHAAHRAMIGWGQDPVGTLVVEQVHVIRVAVLNAIHCRHREAKKFIDAIDRMDKPNEGPMAKLEPVLVPRSPVNGMVEIEF